MNYENVSKLKKWHYERNKGQNYDYLFVSGDICDLSIEDCRDPMKISEAEG